MTIVVPCPKCEHEITINIKKVDKLEARIKELELSLSMYRSGSPRGGFDGFEDLFKGFSK